MREANFHQLSAASSETARFINRRILLNLIRTQQPISRANLSRLSGLQRSTVSLIVEELIQDQWVTEGELGRLPRGRRPTFLLLNEHRAVVCVDIRPSGMTVGMGDVNGRFTLHEVMATPPSPEAAIRELSRSIRKLISERPGISFEGIGLSVPGRIDFATQDLVFAPNLGWGIASLKAPLERETELTVELENAANACALSEMWFAESDEMRDLVAVTVSEGIGTGIIAQGHLITGRYGMAGEFGHIPLDAHGPLCSGVSRGCWEVLASNRAALRYYFEAKAPGALPDQATFSFQDLLHLANKGDVLANRALTRMAVELGRGTRTIIAGLAPETIIFIGEFTAAWERFRPVIEAEVQAQSISLRPTIIRPAQDGSTARLRGTIALVLQKHFGVPTGPAVQQALVLARA